MQDTTTPPDFRDLIDRFPSAREFARLVAGVEHQDKGKIWRRRNRVPSAYHAAVVREAERLGIQGVSLEFLADLMRVGRGEGY